MTVGVGVLGPAGSGWAVLGTDSLGKNPDTGATSRIFKIRRLAETTFAMWAGRALYYPWDDELPTEPIERANAIYGRLRFDHAKVDGPDGISPIALVLTTDPEPRVFRMSVDGITAAQPGQLLDTQDQGGSFRLVSTEMGGRQLALEWLRILLRALPEYTSYPVDVMSVGPGGLIEQSIESEAEVKLRGVLAT